MKKIVALQLIVFLMISCGLFTTSDQKLETQVAHAISQTETQKPIVSTPTYSKTILAIQILPTEKVIAIVSQTSSPTVTPIKFIPTSTFLPMDLPFIVNNWQILITRIEIREELNFYNEVMTAKGRFAILIMSVTNIGSFTDSFVGSHGLFDIVDDKNIRYEEDIVASFEAAVSLYNMQGVEGLDIEPGMAKTLISAYDISESSEHYILVPGIIAETFQGIVSLEIP